VHLDYSGDDDLLVIDLAAPRRGIRAMAGISATAVACSLSPA
jgi:hypothetical protein